MTQLAGGLKWQSMLTSINAINYGWPECGLYPCYGQMMPDANCCPADKQDQFVFD
jgi:hypothetical protein